MRRRILEKQVTVNASSEDVWASWTTVDGITKFFAPRVRALEIRPNGPYEVLFNLNDPPGLQGSEGCRVLSFVPGRMLSFTWGAPPQFPKARSEIAQWVVLFFEPLADSKTLVKFMELGWKEDKEGEDVYSYFERAWHTVLQRLAYSYEHGPIDWDRPWRPAE
jgi:uncharacterized protein YndB with AHSA1/START domain